MISIRAVAKGFTTHIAEMCEYNINRITPELIARVASGGDEIAKGIFEKAGFYLGIAAANVCVSIGPRRIVIGGGVSQAGDLSLEPIHRCVREHVFVMPVEKVEIVGSKLGNNAGVIGVASWSAKFL